MTEDEQADRWLQELDDELVQSALAAHRLPYPRDIKRNPDSPLSGLLERLLHPEKRSPKD